MEPFLKVDVKRLVAEKTSASPKGGNEKRRAEADGAKNVRRRKRRRVAARRTTGRVANCVDKYSVNVDKNQSERRILSALRRIFFEIFTRRRRNGANCVNCARKRRSARCSAKAFCKARRREKTRFRATNRRKRVAKERRGGPRTLRGVT